MGKFTLTVVSYILVAVSELSGQSITAKIQFNPLLHIERKVPLSIGAGFEVGLNDRSSLQLSGSYRIDKQLSWGVDQGPKFYLDYRHYINPNGNRNSGLYISPFTGYGNLRLAEGDEPTGEVISNQRREVVGGLLIGYQPFKRTWFSFDLFAGPEYQRRRDHAVFLNGITSLTSSNRLWLRGGFNICFRAKK